MMVVTLWRMPIETAEKHPSPPQKTNPTRWQDEMAAQAGTAHSLLQDQVHPYLLLQYQCGGTQREHSSVETPPVLSALESHASWKGKVCDLLGSLTVSVFI